MHLARPTERVSYARQPADKQRRLRDMTSRQGKQAMEARPADKELKLRDATSRQGGQAMGHNRPPRKASYWTSSAEQRH